MPLNVIQLERALVKVERLVPFLRRHVEELSQDPTVGHCGQLRATLDQLETQLAVITKQGLVT